MDDKIREIAESLGRAIVESEEFVEYRLAEKGLEEDEKAIALLEEYNGIIGNPMSLSNPEVAEKAETLWKQLSEMDSVKRYISAKEAFEKLLEEINGVIGERIAEGYR